MKAQTNTINQLFNKLSIRAKLFWSFFLTMLLIISVAGWIMSVIIRNAIEANIESELSNSTHTILNMVKSTTNASIKNYLRAVAEKNRDMIRHYYNRYKAGEINESKAIAEAKKVLLSQAIGRTGYIYCLDSRGIIRVHPNKALLGKDISDHTFVRDQMHKKTGYIEYEWANPGESTPRAKALYMIYFEPWDWIVSVSSYREEFIEMINTNDFENSVLSLRFGKTGYSYIIDSNGNFIVHPTLQGSNLSDAGNVSSRKYLRELIKKKHGTIIYPWKNPGEKEPREKLVIFNYIPELDWIVASSSYLDEIYNPLKTVSYTILIVILAALNLAFLTTFFLGKSITNPLYQLINTFKSRSEGDFSHRMTVQSGGEIGELSAWYNDFMERIGNYHHRLLVSEENFRGIFEGAVEGIFKSTSNGEIIGLNPSLAMMLGYRDPAQLLAATGHSIKPLFVEKADGSKILAMLKKNNRISNHEIRLLKKNGTAVWVSLSVRGISDSRGLTDVEGFVNDISEQKKFREKLIQHQKVIEDKNRMLEKQTADLKRLGAIKDDFLAMTTHELRTPLHGMVGIAEALMGGALGSLSQDVISELGLLVSSGKRLSNLVNDLLVASKLKQKDITLYCRPLDLHKHINVVFSIYRTLAKNRALQFKNRVPKDCCVMADEERLQQILHNLVGNAAKFSDSGIITVSAGTADGRIAVQVADTGIGIEKKLIKTIFLPFEQGDYSTTRPYPGTGLGLSITRQLVELHGGNIEVESEPGQGSVFTFTLEKSNQPPEPDSFPVAQTLDIQIAPDDPVPVSDRELADDPKKIVVVDDDVVNLHVVASHLKIAGFTAVTFSSGPDAVGYILENKPAMVLLDIMMPRMDGFQTCRILRETYPLSELPIIFLTARNQVTDLVHGFAMGANDYLTKPFSRDELTARIKTHLMLLEAKDRLLNLRHFMNRLPGYTDINRLFLEAFDVLTKDGQFKDSVLFSHGSPMASKGRGRHFINTIPKTADSPEEVFVVPDHGFHWVFIRIKGLGSHRIVSKTPDPLLDVSLEYARNLVEQIKAVRSGINRFSFDPALSKEVYTIGAMLDDIVYIRAARQYCIIYTETDSTELRLSLKEITIRFSEDILLQVHRSFIVNPGKVTSIQISKKNQIDINLNRIRIPVGGSYASTVLRSFPDAVMEQARD